MVRLVVFYIYYFIELLINIGRCELDICGIVEVFGVVVKMEKIDDEDFWNNINWIKEFESYFL